MARMRITRMSEISRPRAVLPRADDRKRDERRRVTSALLLSLLIHALLLSLTFGDAGLGLSLIHI